MYEPEVSKKVEETLSVKWDSGLKSFFNYNFKINDLISYRPKSGGNSSLGRVLKVTESRVYVKRIVIKNPIINGGGVGNDTQRYYYRRPAQSIPFYLSPNDEVRRGYQLYHEKKEEIKIDTNRYIQDNINLKCETINDLTGEERLKSKSKSKTKLIEKKKYEDEDQVVDYVNQYTSYTSASSILNKRKKSNVNYLDNFTNSFSSKTSKQNDIYDDGIDIDTIEFRNLNQDEYQLIAEKLSYNRFLNQFIKQEKINNELKKEININNSNGKVKTFEISDKRVRRFALKYIKPEDLEKLNSISDQKEEEEEKQEQEKQKYQDQDGNYHYSYENDCNEYNDQPYQEDVYYIEPEPEINYNYNPEYNNENYYDDNVENDHCYYDDIDEDRYSYYSETSEISSNSSYDNSNNSSSNNNINNSSKNIFHQNDTTKQNQIFEKLIKDLNANNNQDFKDDYEKLNNTFESGYILQNELHQRRMDLLRDYFNIDLSKYLI